jgi:regulatory protein
MEDTINNITALKAGKNPRVQRSSVYLNGKFAFSLDDEIIVREKLKVGKQLTTEEIKKISEEDHLHLCLNSAFQFLIFRPRSEAETCERLTRKGYERKVIDKAMIKLKKLKLIDDSSFAEFWKENRNSFQPKSQRMLRLELLRKGVKSEIIQQAVSNIDDSDNAYRVAVKRARTLDITDFQVFRQKLGSYLQRRGFNYGVINNTVKRVWQERTLDDVPQSDSAVEVELPD